MAGREWLLPGATCAERDAIGMRPTGRGSFGSEGMAGEQRFRFDRGSAGDQGRDARMMAASASRVAARSSRRRGVARPAGKSWAASSSAHCICRNSTASCESVTLSVGQPAGTVSATTAVLQLRVPDLRGGGDAHCLLPGRVGPPEHQTSGLDQVVKRGGHVTTEQAATVQS